MVEYTSKVCVELIDRMGDDFRPAEAARVSFNRGKYKEDERNIRLMNYLSREMHFTPFNHIMLSFRIEAPMNVARQLMRHGYLVISEVSMRYVRGSGKYISPQWRYKPDGGIKQGSGPEITEKALLEDIDSMYRGLIEAADTTYRKLLELGVAPEQARFVLPGAIYVKWLWTGSLVAFYRMWEERTSPGAQQETRMYAEKIGEIISHVYPESWKALTSWKTARVPVREGWNS